MKTEEMNRAQILKLCNGFSNAWVLEEMREDCNCESGSLVPFSTNYEGWGGYNYSYDLSRSKLATLLGTSILYQLKGEVDKNLDLEQEASEYGFGALRDSMSNAFSQVFNEFGCEVVDSSFVDDGILDFFNCFNESEEFEESDVDEEADTDEEADYNQLFEDAFNCILTDSKDVVEACILESAEQVEDALGYIGIFVAFDKIKSMSYDVLMSYQDSTLAMGFLPGVCDVVVSTVNVTYGGKSGLLLMFFFNDALNSGMSNLEDTFDYTAIPYLAELVHRDEERQVVEENKLKARIE